MPKSEILTAFREQKAKVVKGGKLDAEGLLTALEPIFARNGYRENRGEAQNVLLLHDAGMGDYINLLPALRYVRQRWPWARLTLMCAGQLGSLVMACPYVDVFCGYDIPWSKVFWHFPELYDFDLQFADGLLDAHFDTAICFAHNSTTLLLAYMSGARERVGYCYDGRDCTFLAAGELSHMTAAALLTKPVPFGLAQARGTHVVDYYLGILEGLWGTEIEDRKPQLGVLPEDEKHVRQELARAGLKSGGFCCAIVAGGTRAGNHWPPERYAELAGLLAEREPDLRFLLLGGREDHENSEFIRRAAGAGRACNLAGVLSQRESAAALSLCRLYIGNDTGLMHIAAALDVPVLSPQCYPAQKGLNEMSTPYVYRPYGTLAVVVLPEVPLEPCRYVDEDTHGCAHISLAHCITQIEPETMLAGYDLLLAEQGRQRCRTVFAVQRSRELLQEGEGRLYVLDFRRNNRDGMSDTEAYLRLYDHTQALMRSRGMSQGITRSAFAREVQDNIHGHWRSLNTDMLRDVPDSDFLQMLFLRMFRRLPEAEEWAFCLEERASCDREADYKDLIVDSLVKRLYQTEPLQAPGQSGA